MPRFVEAWVNNTEWNTICQAKQENPMKSMSYRGGGVGGTPLNEN